MAEAAAGANFGNAAAQPAMAQPGPPMATTGTVFDPLGAPAPHVSLAVWRSTLQNLAFSSASDGKYTARWQALGQQLGSPHLNTVLIGRDLTRNLAAAQDLDEAAANLDLRLGPGLTISGSVQDPDGAPATNATVDLQMTLNNSSGILCQTPCDAHGLFSINALPPRGIFVLAVRARGYGSVRGVHASFDGSQTLLELPPIKLKPATLEVAGIVVGPDDNPVPGILVSFAGQDQSSEEVKTDARGHFNFKHVVEGRGSLSVRLVPVNGAPPFTSRMTTRGGDTDVLFKLFVPRTGVGQPVRIGDPGVPEVR
jgi:hypothetical protein